MKNILRTAFIAASFAAVFSCSMEEPYTGENSAESGYIINVADFPAFGQTGTKAVGTADEGKSSWETGDVILVRIGTECLSITYNGTSWDSSVTGAAQSGSAEVTAWYAPDYEWNNNILALKSECHAGLSEFLEYSYVDEDLSDGINIVFSGSREYSRIRVATVAGMEVSLAGDFIPVNGSYAVAENALTAVADEFGNAFFYGSWNDDAVMNFTVGDSVIGKTLSAGTGNKSYALKAGGYRYDAETATAHISDLEGLKAWAALENVSEVNAILYENIALDETGWTTVASYAGTFDGNGFSIDGLNAPFIDALSGTVTDVKFLNADISAATTACGIVSNTLTGSVMNTAVTGEIAPAAKADAEDTGLGGIAGTAGGNAWIDNCYTHIKITPHIDFVTGGIVGAANSSEGGICISNCTAAGEISRGTNSGIPDIGGILGRVTTRTGDHIVRNCLATVIISSGSNQEGGILGSVSSNNVTIEKCAFTGSVTGARIIAGIAGISGESISDCYVSGSVIANTTSTTQTAGGIVCNAKGDVMRCVVFNSTVSGPADADVAGIIVRRVSSSPEVQGCAVIGSRIVNGRAIYGTASEDASCTGNYRWMVTNNAEGSAYTALAVDTYGQDGIGFSAAPTQRDFEDMGFDFTETWEWNDVTGSPVLRHAGCDPSVIPAAL